MNLRGIHEIEAWKKSWICKGPLYLTASLIYNDFETRDGLTVSHADLFGFLKDDKQQKEDVAFFLFRNLKGNHIRIKLQIRESVEFNAITWYMLTHSWGWFSSYGRIGFGYSHSGVLELWITFGCYQKVVTSQNNIMCGSCNFTGRWLLNVCFDFFEPTLKSDLKEVQNNSKLSLLS